MHGGKCTTFFRIPGVLHLHFEYILKTPSLIFKYLQSIRNRKIIEKSFLSESWVKEEKHFHNNKKKRHIKFYNSLDTQFLYDMIIPYPRISTLTQTAR